MRLMLTGDSHVVAIGNALAEFELKPPFTEVTAAKMFSFPQTLKPFYRVEADRIVFDAEPARAAMQAISGGEDLVPSPDVLAMCLGFTTTRFLRSPIWKKVRPWSTPGPQRPLSDAEIRAMADDHFKYSTTFVRDALAIGVRLVIIEAPPPCATDPIMTRGLTPEMVLAIDRLAREATKAALSGVAIVETPPAAAYRGFLKRGYRKSQNDHHHANAAYGALVLPLVMAGARGLTVQTKPRKRPAR